MTTYVTASFSQECFVSLKSVYQHDCQTPWNGVLLGNLIRTQIIKKFPAFCGTRRLITACIKAYYLLPFGTLLSLCSDLTPRSTPKMEDHPLSSVRECIFSTFAAAFRIGGRSFTRNVGTRHTVVTGAHLSRIYEHMFTFMVEYFSALRREEASFFEMLVATKQTTCHSIEALKTDTVYSVSYCVYRAPRVQYVQFICTLPFTL